MYILVSKPNIISMEHQAIASMTAEVICKQLHYTRKLRFVLQFTVDSYQ